MKLIFHKINQKGTFLKGVASPGTVVAFYPGILVIFLLFFYFSFFIFFKKTKNSLV